MSTPIFLAEYDSRSFSFQAIGATEKSARAALVKGLRDHARQYDLPLNWYRDGMTAAEFAYEINVSQMWYGVTLRDGSPIRVK